MRLRHFSYTILIYSSSFINCYGSDSANEGTILNKLGKPAYCFKDVEYQGKKYICEQVIQAGEICKGDGLGYYVNDKLMVYKAPNVYFDNDGSAQFECESDFDTVFCHPKSAVVEATATLGDLYGKAKNYFSWDEQSPIQGAADGVENIYGYMSISYFFDLMGGAKDGNRTLANSKGDKPVAPSLVVRDLFKQLEEQGLVCEGSKEPTVSQFFEQARHGRATLDVIIKLYSEKVVK